jgi:hypothetical protein
MSKSSPWRKAWTAAFSAATLAATVYALAAPYHSAN